MRRSKWITIDKNSNNSRNHHDKITRYQGISKKEHMMTQPEQRTPENQSYIP